MKRSLLFLGVFLSFYLSGTAQSSCSTCTAVTTFTANLSANPNSTYTVNSGRNGLCCQGAGSDRCIVFEVTVHPNASQIQFLVSTGNNGTWQINCDTPTYTPSSKPCLNGLSSFCITYCNPGGAADTYTITTSSGFAAGPDLQLRGGCVGQLTVSGLNESSITWNSVVPGTVGQYNSYLSCLSACDTTNVTPAAGSPSFIDYRVCGTTTGCTSGTYCDTQRVYVSPALTVAITPTAPVICSGTAVTLTTTATGGLAPYTYTWSPGGATTSTLSTTTSGVYTVSVNDATAGCGPVTQTVNVTTSTTPTITSASTATICSGSAVNLAFTANTASNYSWIGSDNANTTGESLTTQTNDSLTDVIVNTSTSVQTVVYTVTPTSTGGCAGAAQTVTITVNPTPSATATPSSQSICSGGSTGITLTSNVAGTTFSWTVTQTNVSGASASSGTLIAQALSTTTTSAGTAVYTITPTGGSCPGTPIVASVTVNPIPSATATPASSSLCSGGATNIALTSNMGGTTYSWVVSQSGATGASAGTGAAITHTLTATGSTPGTVTYTITPSVGTCPGTPIVATVTVNPIPTVTATPTSQSLCSGATSTVTLTSNVAGATFSWAVTQTNVTGASASSGTVIAQTLTATSTSAGTAVYTITPSSAGCPGAAATVTITVNPLPSATATPSSQSICSNSASSVTLTSNIAGTTFAWTVTQTNVSGASASSGTVIAQTLTATSTSAGTAVYTITPSVGGCAGAPITATVTVNPIPTVTATPASQTLCSGGATSIALTSNMGSTTFSWTVAQSGVSGASNSSGSAITQTLTATGTSAGTATYTITPTASGCPGTPVVVTVTVNPTPTVTATPSSQTICSGNTTSIALTSNVSGTTFSWTVTQSNVTGASASSGATIAQTLTATTAGSGTAIYTITPSAAGCPGVATTATVTVSPAPTVTATPSSQNVCSGNATSISLTSSTGGTTFAWTVTQTGASGASAGSGSSITQTLTATGASVGTAVYTVTPTAAGCAGTPIVVTVSVNPAPSATATPSSQSICSNNITSIALTSNVTGTTFNWTVTQTNVTGASASSGTVIAQTLTATSTSTGTAVYTITPSVGGCPGAAITATVTVNPAPSMTATPTTQTLCSGGTTGITLTSSTGGATFAWTVTQTNVSGASAGSGATIAQTLNATSSVNGTAVYTITPTAGGCAGTPVTVTVTVRPIPSATATPSSQSICSGGATSISLTSNVTGTTFAWTVSQSGVTGASNSSGATIAQTLSTTGTSAGTATYTITPTANTCAGTPIVVSVTVNPTPTATATPASSSMCSGSTTNISLTSNVAGTTFAWTVGQSGVTGASNSSGSTIAQTISTTTNAVGTATYTITPTAGTCPGAPIVATVTVNPVPVMTSVSSATICSGQTVSIPLTANVASTFTWVAADNPNTTGESTTTQTTSTISNTITSTTGNTEVVVYTVTPTSTGGSCAGSSQTVSVTISPTPVLTVTPTSQSICSGGTTTLSLTSQVAGSSFTWTVTQSGVSGGSNGSGSIISQTLTTTGTVSGTAIYTITPGIGTCTGAPGTATVTVNPVPSLTATPASQAICSGNATSISLTSNVAGTTFAWTAGQSGVSGASNGTGSSITQTLTATGTSPGTVDYTITPTAGSCAGTPIVVTVTVNPIPSVTATPSSQAFCSGGSTSVALTSNITGATFSWAVTQTGVSGASSGSGANITQTLTTTGASAGTAVYTVTPASGACAGTPIVVSVTVNPTPATPAPFSNSPVCINDTIKLSTASVGGATYNWSGPNSFSSALQNPNIANATTAEAGTYSLSITANGCTSATQTVAVAVNTPPPGTLTPTANSPLCTGQTLNLSIGSITGASWSWSGPNSFTSTTQNPSISNIQLGGAGVYTVNASVPGCAGSGTGTVSVVVNQTPAAPIPGSNSPLCEGSTLNLNANGTGTSYNWTGPNSFTDSIQNPSISNVTAANAGVYSVTTTDNGCTSAIATTTVVVQQAPVANAGPDQVVCKGTPNASLSGTVTVSNTGTWTSTGTGTFTPNANTLTATYVPSSADTAAGSVTLVLTSTNNGSCPPHSDTLVITYTEIPVVSAGSNQTVCANNMNITLNGSVTGGSTTGVWSTSGSGTFSPDSTTLNASYNPSNADTAAGTVTLTLTSTGGCIVVTDQLTITITDAPGVSAGSDIFVCANNADAAFSGTVSGATSTGNWTTSGTGTFTPSSTALTGTYTPSAADISSGSVYLVLTSTGNGSCLPAVDSVLLTFTQPPTAFAGNDSVFCANASFTLAGVITGGAGTGAWTSAGGGTFSPNANALNANYAPSAADTAAGTVTLILTSTNNGGCLAASDSIVLTITDAPSVNAGADQTVCSNNSVVTLNGQVTVSTGLSWSTLGDGTFGSANATTTTYTPGANDISSGTVTIVASSTGNGDCVAATDTVLLIIEAAPIVNAGSDQFLCSGVGTATLSGSITGSTSTGTWTTLGTGTFASANSLSTTYSLSPADSAAASVTLVLTSTNNGSCNANTDTIVLTITPAGIATAGGDSTICSSNTITLSGAIAGGTGVGQWSTSGTGTFTPSDTTLNAAYSPSAADATAGSVVLTLTPINACMPQADSLVLTILPSAIVGAGSDVFICATSNTVTLNGSVTGGSTTGTWTTLGSGTFSPNDSTLNAVYTLSLADSAAGSVTLVLTSTNNGLCNAVTDTVVISTTIATAAVAGADTSICSNDSLALSGIINGGSAGQWSTSGTGTFSPDSTTLNASYLPSAADVSAGSVILTLTPSSGCNPAADSLVLTLVPAALVSAGSNTVICASTNTVGLNGSVSGGSTTGVWTTNGTGTFSPNDSTLNATYNVTSADSAAGSITLVLTSTNNGNCGSVKDSITVIITTPATAQAGSDVTVCANNGAVNLGGTITGGTGQGQWTTSGSGTFSPADTVLGATYTPSASDASAGSVVLTLNAVNSCTPAMDSLVVTITPAPTVNAGADTILCGGMSTISLSGSINTVPTGAVWTTNGSGTFSPNDSTLNATYTPAAGDSDTLIFVLTTSGNGLCNPEDDTIRVIRTSKPGANFVYANSCLGQTVSFTDSTQGPVVTWQWDLGNGNVSNVQNPTSTYTASGTYTVTLVASAGTGCEDTIQKAITINPSPVASFSLSNSCLGDSVQFTDGSTIAPGAISSWSWNFGDNGSSNLQNPVHAYDSANVYTVSLTVQSDSGCSATVTQTVSIIPPPEAGFTSQSNCGTLLVNYTDTSGVSGDSIVLWSWNFGDGNTATTANPSNTYSATGTYTVLLQVQTASGCTDTASTVVTISQNITADYTPAGGSYNTNQDINFTNQSTGGTTYSWNFGDGDSSSVSDPAHSFTEPGTYTVTLITSNDLGCSDTIAYVFDVNTTGVTVPSGFTPDGDGLNDFFYVMGGPFTSYELRVFNEWGNEIFSSSAQADKWDGTFKGVKQPAGTYIYVFNGITADGKSISLQNEINIIR